MPADEYAAAGGGALKLKGAKISKKKKRAKAKDLSSVIGRADQQALSETTTKKKKSSSTTDKTGPEAEEEEPLNVEDDDYVPSVKTETELRHERMKKQRVRDRPAPCLLALSNPYIPTYILATAALTLLVAPNGGELGLETGAAQDAQGEGGGTKHIPIETERASRHAQDRTGLSRHK